MKTYPERKAFPALACATAAACGLAVLNTVCAAGPTAGREPPNMVYIMADDHACNAISAYGSPLIRTPNIDRIAAQGAMFTQAMVANSICSPSRATLLTGKYSHKNGVRKLNETFDGS